MNTTGTKNPMIIKLNFCFYVCLFVCLLAFFSDGGGDGDNTALFFKNNCKLVKIQ